jgi:RNA polymerase sigma-70 factor (ECF subfamily)
VLESELIVRAQRGDEAAWTELVRLHQEAAFRLAYLLLGDPDDAADAAQEAFIRAFQALDRFDTDRPLRPWLLRITTNLAHNRRRSLSRYVAALRRAVQRDPDGDGAANSAEQVLAERERARLLRRAVKRLKRTDQEVIFMRLFLELPVEETAQALEIAPGTVKSRLHRALNRLRKIIEADFPGLREKDGG